MEHTFATLRGMYRLPFGFRSELSYMIADRSVYIMTNHVTTPQIPMIQWYVTKRGALAMAAKMNVNRIEPSISWR